MNDDANRGPSPTTDNVYSERHFSGRVKSAADITREALAVADLLETNGLEVISLAVSTTPYVWGEDVGPAARAILTPHRATVLVWRGDNEEALWKLGDLLPAACIVRERYEGTTRHLFGAGVLGTYVVVITAGA
jgi:hypothetical protein